MDASNPSYTQWCSLIDEVVKDPSLLKGGYTHPNGKAEMERKWNNLKKTVEGVEGATANKTVAQWKTAWSKLKQRVTKAYKAKAAVYVKDKVTVPEPKSLNLPAHYVYYLQKVGIQVDLTEDDNEEDPDQVEEVEVAPEEGSTQEAVAIPGTPSLEKWLEEAGIFENPTVNAASNVQVLAVVADDHNGLQTPIKTYHAKSTHTPPRSGLTPSSKRRLCDESQFDWAGCIPFVPPKPTPCVTIDLTDEAEEICFLDNVKQEQEMHPAPTHLESVPVKVEAGDDTLKEAIRQNTAALQEILLLLRTLQIRKE